MIFFPYFWNPLIKWTWKMLSNARKTFFSLSTRCHHIFSRIPESRIPSKFFTNNKTESCLFICLCFSMKTIWLVKKYWIWDWKLVRALRAYLPSQSAPTVYSCFENMGRFVTLKKRRYPKYGLQKAKCKKQGYCYQKQKRQPCLFSFWIMRTLSVFCILIFSTHILDLFLKFQTMKIDQADKPDKLKQWRLTGQLSAA